ncbi:MAG: response regulator transcription factor [Sedimenticolaceae bacterium]|nr:response regulator transcription factor [Gammaproteobacteria bacterium]
MHILVIEDNPDLAGNLCDFLEARRHTVDIVNNGLAGLRFCLENSYDVVVLDLMLPGMDGLEVCSRMRAAGRTTPVLMLTARDTLANKLEGFGSGADDYLVKPFAMPELEARLLALARRGRGELTTALLMVADLTFDPKTLRVERAGQRIELAPIPLRILSTLMRYSPGVVRREDLEREIWADNPPDSDALRAHIHALRSAIDRGAVAPLLHTVRGIGYQLAGPDER